ncbi:MAG: amidohydrolase family protein [Gammaproteobacteria bacterium]|nr:amidohydrolase family protein [Gammaproteobacteria bacterium]
MQFRRIGARRALHAFGWLVAMAGFALPAHAAEENSDDTKWDVNNPPGPKAEVNIDVRSGTWMNVDVSPDGKMLAFDLLGDIYVMPIDGGEPTQVTSGMAWDMQPRFSPDGKRIAFTSDRAGGNNIWVMDSDGSDAYQVTDESFRLLNNPDWTPDGEYIVARKHFTGWRSLGAGEMWLYHASGEGSGLQLTERPNDQKDVNDPAFSPDGRYLYFDQDTTPGDLFEYGKDSTGQIFEIRRLDRETGELENYISGPGGAIKPTPSPDGKWLAFIRRHDFDTKLYIKNIESGEIIELYGEMERDMQEIWSIHGVYSNMAWTPDSEELVFWAGGKLKRLDVDDRDIEEIPFHVKKTMEIRQALRRDVDVAPDQFETKMLRWVTVSPDGDKVVFEALGKLWVRDLPNGKPERLTSQEDHFELYPSWSRDSDDIVYVTWDDEELGSVRIVDADGGRGDRINEKPGHFVEPAFSPDGETVVFRRTGGGYLRAPLWAEQTGIFAVDADGGTERLLSESGNDPQFADSSDRVYLVRVAGGKRELFSVDMSGANERVHLQSEYMNDIALSPNGKWVAFQERFNAFIAPFVPTGKPVMVGPNAKSIPVQQVSKDAGEYIHWSGDSDTLHWSLGAELYSRDLKNAFSFIDGAPEELPEPPAEGRNIGFDVEYDKPDSRVALVGGRIITMKGDEVIEDGVILVASNRIVEVGARGSVEIPSGYETVDMSGKTLMPGIVDAHWHGAQGTQEFIPETNWVNMSSLAFGVTTIHDPSNDTSTIFAASEYARAGEIIGPRIFSTGTILYGATTSFTAEVDSLEDAMSHLRRMKAVGAISVKSYNQPRRDQRQQILEAGRQLDIMVVPEGGALFQTNLNQVVDGHTTVEHSLSVENIYDDVVQLWSQTEVGYTPTLGVGYGGLRGEDYWYAKTNVWQNERLMRWVPYERVAPRSRRRETAPDKDWNHIKLAEDAALLQDNGVLVNVGAHGQREGLAAHWEMWMFGQGGMTPLEAIRAGTLDPAKTLGMDDDIGSLEKGKLADIAILERNPLEDIRNSEFVSHVMINGRLYDTTTMKEIVTGDSERGYLFWKD